MNAGRSAAGLTPIISMQCPCAVCTYSAKLRDVFSARLHTQKDNVNLSLPPASGDLGLFSRLRPGLCSGLPSEALEWRRTFGRAVPKTVSVDAEFVPLGEGEEALDDVMAKVEKGGIRGVPVLHTFWIECPVRERLTRVYDCVNRYHSVPCKLFTIPTCSAAFGLFIPRVTSCQINTLNEIAGPRRVQVPRPRLHPVLAVRCAQVVRGGDGGRHARLGGGHRGERRWEVRIDQMFSFY